MKRYLPYLLLGLLPWVQGCATLDSQEIRSLNRVPFADLTLQPAVEPTQLRVDVVRQQTQQQTGPSPATYQDVPYHPLGFDLGNGLFYDLNGNLSFRVNALLSVKEQEAFQIRKDDLMRKKRSTEFYTLANDSLMLSFGYKDQVREQYVQTGTADSLAFKARGTVDFEIVKSESTTTYQRRGKARFELVKESDTHYVLDRLFSNLEYIKVKNRLELGRHFIIELSNGNQSINVLRRSILGRKLVFTIERSPAKILVYTPRSEGKKIEFDRAGLTITKNRTPYNRYSLIQ